jgi:hypothetical protein
LSELSFIDGRQKSPGEFVPRDAFVLHLYGRYCNANKFAGEIDLLEALDHVHRGYRIDADRIAVRGFDGRGSVLAVRGSLSRPLPRQPRRGLLRNRGLPEGVPERTGAADVV